jgi:hypothetical protein
MTERFTARIVTKTPMAHSIHLLLKDSTLYFLLSHNVTRSGVLVILLLYIFIKVSDNEWAKMQELAEAKK